MRSGYTAHASAKNSNLLRSSAFVNNAWVSAKSNKTFAVIDPATGEEITKVPEMNVEDTRKRHDIMKKWFDLINENKEDLATILTWENGKARGEITYGNSFIEWFAEEAVRVYGDVIQSPFRNQRFVVLKQPVGVVGVITPWNFPNAMITRKVAAALAAGCTVVVKPGAETPLSALALVELGVRAGLPPGVLNVVTTHEHVNEVGLELCENKEVKKVSFTGSVGMNERIIYGNNLKGESRAVLICF
ncbi:hypothetical protein BC937DRAFT_88262 [Endogone sp. FLAS-F59071]|nr:hypothetical protein BC937DRAFT_88262 [Endogone sp. FLAS-F59071]|eukprot:RUS18853.1 hypothetical protein BC937DRAFT_88262 [Endogone sp. FLAS-F59071]